MKLNKLIFVNFIIVKNNVLNVLPGFFFMKINVIDRLNMLNVISQVIKKPGYVYYVKRDINMIMNNKNVLKFQINRIKTV